MPQMTTVMYKCMNGT